MLCQKNDLGQKHRTSRVHEKHSTALHISREQARAENHWIAGGIWGGMMQGAQSRGDGMRSFACLSTLCPSDCIPRFTQGQTRYGATRAAFRASVHFICAGERAAAATRARRYVLEGIVGGVRATRPIAPKRTERLRPPARRRGGTIGWPLLCPAQHLGRSQTCSPS